MFTTQTRCTEYLRVNGLTQREGLLEDVEKLGNQGWGSHSTSNQPLIEVDAFAELMFTTFAQMREEKEKNVVDLFLSADIEADGLLDLEEFQILCYHLNRQNGE